MPATPDLVHDELDLLASLVPLDGLHLVELGCGDAKLARSLVQRHPGTELTGCEVDAKQHARNLQAPQKGLHFLHAGAQQIPADDAAFDGALMLKSLHHVPMPLMDRALAEVARVLEPGGWLYVSEPVFDGALNELIRVFNDERVVRAAAQKALDDALRDGAWTQQAERRFDMPVRFDSFDEFEQRAMRPSWAEHRIDDAILATVRRLYAPHQRADGAHFVRPMHVRLLRRR